LKSILLVLRGNIKSVKCGAGDYFSTAYHSIKPKLTVSNT